MAVKLSDEITQELGYEYCQKFGISTLVKNKTINGKVFDDSTSQTLALGGITEGVYNYEMCAAYATIANGGEYNKPTLYSKVVDHDGNVLLDGTGESHTVIKDSTAYLLTNAMEDVVNSGTGTACQLPNMPVAGKTGTTTSNKDLWFCGFTPYYTCAVWGGYDDNKECDYDTSFRFRLWKGIMSRIHENLEEKDFKVPSSVERKSICTITGNSQEADARLLQNILQKTLCLLRHVPDTDILTEANPTLPQKMTAVPMLILPDLLPEKTAVIQRPVIRPVTQQPAAIQPAVLQRVAQPVVLQVVQPVAQPAVLQVVQPVVQPAVLQVVQPKVLHLSNIQKNAG